METPSITVKKINKGRFKKGSITWNKGLKGFDAGRLVIPGSAISGSPAAEDKPKKKWQPNVLSK